MIPERRPGQWLKIEVCLLVCHVAAIYFGRLTALGIRGGESRQARIAYGMLETGDRIVPRQPGEPFLSRP